MKLSIVIPAFNEERLLGGTLAAVKAAASGAFDPRSWAWEIVVCDNNSTDRTAEIAARSGARVVFEPVNQISRARNAGAAAARGEWLLFIDADSQPSAGLLGDLAAAVEAGRAIAGGSTIEMDREIAARWRIWVIGWNALSRLVRWAAGSFLFCRADAFRAVGGFGQDFFAAEEIDLSMRLKRHARSVGGRVVILTEHPLVTSARKLDLYSFGDHVRVFAQSILFPRRFLRSREACFLWYDGRR
ncbi:MAG: glycosyltransferase [Verrucomicrobiales bacterium]